MTAAFKHRCISREMPHSGTSLDLCIGLKIPQDCLRDVTWNVFSDFSKLLQTNLYTILVVLTMNTKLNLTCKTRCSSGAWEKLRDFVTAVKELKVLQKNSSHCERLVLLRLSTLSADISVPNNMTDHETLG